MQRAGACKHGYVSAFQFTTSMVSALAWPVIVGGVLLALPP
jgi:hypothetical protein